MDMNHFAVTNVFANDNAWDRQAAIMLGRFIALQKFRERYQEGLRAMAISPQFFYIAQKIIPKE